MPETVQPASTRQTANAVRPGGGKEGLRRRRDERGAATAEYVIATMAAVGFAGLLIVILRGDEVRGILTDLVRNALTVG
jgi:Flp pilus assembly pilin Flp